MDFDFKDIVESAQDVIIVTKADNFDHPGPEIVYVNKAFTELTGYSQDEAIGQTPRMLQGDDTDEESKQNIRVALEKKEPIRLTIKNYSKYGQEYWLDLNILPLKNPEGQVTHFVAIQRDVTESICLQRELEVLSRTDDLTGLINRREFNCLLKKEFLRFKRNALAYAVLMIDADSFKRINDYYGHSTGDSVLQKIAQICSADRRFNDVLARIGGEEFCLLLPEIDKDQAFLIAEKLRLAVMKSSMDIVHDSVPITISIGVSVVKESDINPEETLCRADKNLYKAKGLGRNCTVKD